MKRQCDPARKPIPPAVAGSFAGAAAQAVGETPNDQLQRALGGDRAALNDLFIQNFDALREFIERHRVDTPHIVLETDDVLQETFVHAIKGFATFEPTDEKSFEHWLSTIAQHTLQSLATAATAQKRGGRFRRMFRQRKRAGDSSLTVEFDPLRAKNGTGSEVAANKEAVAAMLAQIARLPTEQQQAIQLRFMQGQSLDEIAEGMNGSLASVRGLLYRGKRRVHEAMGRSSRWFGR